jgi:hypothetical protein
VGLASQGIAVLRYEKRTREHAALMAKFKDSITVKEETIDDAIAAVTLLRERADIDTGKIFVLGHSLGGMLVPRIGHMDPRIAGFIVMAGAARPLEDIMLEQVMYLSTLSENRDSSAASTLEKMRQQIAAVKSPTLSSRTSPENLLGAPATYWLDLRGYDPAKSAATLGRPMVILQGERDYQVTMDNFKRWKEGLAGVKGITFISYPGLNHLFISGEGKSVPSEYQKAGHVAEDVIRDIAGWARKQ